MATILYEYTSSGEKFKNMRDNEVYSMLGDSCLLLGSVFG